ncbi:MAG: hypothetical protein JST67_08400 [Bacteroidetes bacterium]|nr:hypothetical protein [Bacteroidota bacterium]
MKKLSILALAAGAVLVACGPSKAELEAAEKAKQDSLTAVMKADSAAAAEKAAVEAAAAQAKADSLATVAKADSLKKAEEEAKGKGHHAAPHKKETGPVRTGATKEGAASGSGAPAANAVRTGGTKSK